MAREENCRWAVVNTNLDTGQSVQYMESPQEFAAQAFVDKANESFKKAGRNCKSELVKLK